MAEYYPDTIEVDSSNLSVITALRLNSTGENYRYKVVVGSSNLSVATILVRNSIGLRVPVFYTGSCEFESHRANKGNIVQRQNSWLLAIR
jgi:hypothetical protein